MKSKLTSTWRLIKPIQQYLYGYSLLSIAVLINILTLNIKMKPDESTNSVLLIVPSGSGKTTLLHHILQKSNPKWFPQLPEKFFESEILQEPDDKFDRKVWVQDDLITTFRGTSTKQREQLMGFFNTFFTKGEYGRRGVRKKGRIVCVFGLAKDHYNEYGKQMFLETFADRFARLKHDFDEKGKLRILEVRSKSKNRVLPNVELPLKERCIDVKVPNSFYYEVNRLAMALDSKQVMSFARAQTHIANFAKANADLNNRRVVAEEDLKLFKLVMPLYFDANSGNVDTMIRETMVEYCMNGKAAAGREIKNLLTKNDSCSERHVERVLSDLRDQNVVNYRKISGSRGYDFKYWL